jgi:hypothetical protein
MGIVAGFKKATGRAFQFRALGTLILILLPLLAVIGVMAPTLLDQENLALLSIYLATPMILSTFFYWKYCRDV